MRATAGAAGSAVVVAERLSAADQPEGLNVDMGISIGNVVTPNWGAEASPSS